MNDYKYKVACFGAGFVGIPTSAVLASKNPDKQVSILLSSLSCTTSINSGYNCVNKTLPTFTSTVSTNCWEHCRERTSLLRLTFIWG